MSRYVIGWKVYFTDSVVVHEWGHLRYGLKDEYPTLKKAGVENTVNSVDTVNFYQENGTWKPVGYASKLFVLKWC